MSRLVAILAGILAFVLSPPSMAHHGGFYEAMGKAIETQDLESVRDRFTASAWKSEGEGLDGVSLHRRLAAAEAVDADGVLEYSRDERCLVAVRFYEKGVDEPRIHWLAGAKVLPGREPEARPWRVVRILSEVKEAREYLRNPRIRSHIEGPPLDAADAEIARRARAVLGREEAAQEVCAEGAWDRTDELSIRGFREKPPEKGVRLLTRGVDRKGDRIVVRLVYWHREEDRLAAARFVLLVREGETWKVFGGTDSRKAAEGFLEGRDEPGDRGPGKTQQAIFTVKRYIEENLSKELNHIMVQAPQIVSEDSGVTDTLDRYPDMPRK